MATPAPGDSAERGGLGTPLDLGKVRTLPIETRRNLVTIAALADPAAPPPAWDHPELDELVGRLAAAARQRRVLLWSLGAHVVKAGLAPYLIELIRKGLVGHLAGNGAVAIHDFEFAMLDATSESVAEGIRRGTFGMWEETGSWMHDAIARDPARGYGRALGEYIDAHPERFPHRERSLLWQAHRAGVPFTVHVSIGCDIIHQHPRADFAAIGAASGADFKIYCRAVSMLARGAFLNFGSAVTGPEVFLKALSVARNLGYAVEGFTTANFDIVPLGDYRHAPVTNEVKPEFYYRPWKNIVVRPAGLGGKGFHIEGRHQDTLPVLYHRLMKALS